MANKSITYAFKKGERYNTSDLPIPINWYSDFFENSDQTFESEKNKDNKQIDYESDICKKSFSLTIKATF